MVDDDTSITWCESQAAEICVVLFCQAESVLIQEQDKEHREISQSLQDALPRLEEAKKKADELSPLIGVYFISLFHNFQTL